MSGRGGLQDTQNKLVMLGLTLIHEEFKGLTFPLGSNLPTRWEASGRHENKVENGSMEFNMMGHNIFMIVLQYAVFF